MSSDLKAAHYGVPGASSEIGSSKRSNFFVILHRCSFDPADRG